MRSTFFTALVVVATMTQAFGAALPSSTPAGPVSEVQIPSGLPIPTPSLPAGGIPIDVPQAGSDVPAIIPTLPGTNATLPTTVPSGAHSVGTSSVAGPTDLTDKVGDLIGDGEYFSLLDQTRWRLTVFVSCLVSKNVSVVPAVPTLPVSAPTLPVSPPVPNKDEDSSGLPVAIPSLNAPSTSTTPSVPTVPTVPNTSDIIPSGTPSLPISLPDVQVPSGLPIPDVPAVAPPSGSGIASAPVTLPVAVPVSVPGQA
ncbi:hypothetical protein K474DRAFT_607480 [Panus rudis PR-1116 ss-1]|nr:hypothetical protein K474DRAFT_607480 [Panus rudis PR-1116 ss-1]